MICALELEICLWAISPPPPLPANVAKNRCRRRVKHFENLLLSLFLCVEYLTAVTVLSLVSKTIVAVTLPISHVYSVELYPTEMRSFGFALTFMASRIGSIVSPYLGDPLVRHYYCAL